MAIHIIDEANRCLNCKKPKCMEGCPVHTPVPHIIQLFKEHRLWMREENCLKIIRCL